MWKYPFSQILPHNYRCHNSWGPFPHLLLVLSSFLMASVLFCLLLSSKCLPPLLSLPLEACFPSLSFIPLPFVFLSVCLFLPYHPHPSLSSLLTMYGMQSWKDVHSCWCSISTTSGARSSRWQTATSPSLLTSMSLHINCIPLWCAMNVNRRVASYFITVTVVEWLNLEVFCVPCSRLTSHMICHVTHELGTYMYLMISWLHPILQVLFNWTVDFAVFLVWMPLAAF